MFLIVFVFSYVHLGFMYRLLFNESLLHYLSIMRVPMMVFCVCMNDSAHLLYISVYFCLWRSCLWWVLILHVAFSFNTCIIMVLVRMLKVQNRFELQCVLLNLLVYIQISLFIYYSFILYILQFCCIFFFTIQFWQPQLLKSFFLFWLSFGYFLITV